MQYVVDDRGSKVSVLLSIQEYNDYLKLKERFLFGENYEETEEDLIITADEKKAIEKLRVERKKGNLKQL